MITAFRECNPCQIVFLPFLQATIQENRQGILLNQAERMVQFAQRISVHHLAWLTTDLEEHHQINQP